MDSQPDVVVIGGGITGLAAAYELTRRGLRPLILEASPRAGGLIHTERADGFTIEAGPESVLAAKPAALDLARELGLERAIQTVRPPGGAFVLRGLTLYPLPKPSILGIPQTWAGLAGYALLSPAAGARGARAAGAAAARRRRRVDRLLFPPALRRGVGGSHRPAAARRHPRGRHRDALDAVALSAAARSRAHPWQHPARTSRGARPRGADPVGPDPVGPDLQVGPSPAISPFRSLRGGMGTLVDALEARLGSGAIRCGSPVRGIERAAEGWRVGDQIVRAVIVAAPAAAAAPLLAPIDGEAADLCARVPYVSTASIALAWPRAAIPHPLAGTGFVVARQHSDVRITACTWVSSKWDGRAPEGTALLRAFAGGAHDPDVVSLSDEALVDVVRRDLGRVLGVTAAPSLARVHRWTRAGAQHLVGHLARVETIERRLAGHGGLFVAGSGFRAVGIPDCIADARRVAAAAAEYLRGATR